MRKSKSTVSWLKSGILSPPTDALQAHWCQTTAVSPMLSIPCAPLPPEAEQRRRMPWPPDLRSQSPACSKSLLGSQKVSIAARVWQTKSKKVMPVIIMQMVAIQNKADPCVSPHLLPCSLLAEVVFSFLFALLDLVYRFLSIYGACFSFLITIL